MAARNDQEIDIISQPTDGNIDRPNLTASKDVVVERPDLTPGTGTTKVKKPCTFYVHTMEHQTNNDKQLFEFKFDRKPSEVTADEIMDKTIAKLSIPAEKAKKCFAMWLTSPLLQLQVKGHFHPYELHKQWKNLLVCYTNCDFDAKENDIPILSFQRNAFYPIGDEIRIVNEAIVHLLYEEAKLNALRGNYPMDIATLVKLAAILAAKKSSNRNEIGNHLADYFPYHMVRKTRGYIIPKLKPPYKPSLEDQVMTEIENYSSSNSFQLEQDYLETCRDTGYYGSVFFAGQTVRASTNTSLLFGHSDRPVTVAINTQGLHIISQSAPPEILIFLPYCDMKSDYIECHASGEEFYSSILLEYDSQNDNKKKQLKIYSRQAPLIENMIKTVYDNLKRRGGTGKDEPDFGRLSNNQRRCKEHPLLVCDIVEDRSAGNTQTGQPSSNGRGDGGQIEMQTTSSSNQRQHEQPVAASVA